MIGFFLSESSSTVVSYIQSRRHTSKTVVEISLDIASDHIYHKYSHHTADEVHVPSSGLLNHMLDLNGTAGSIPSEGVKSIGAVKDLCSLACASYCSGAANPPPSARPHVHPSQKSLGAVDILLLDLSKIIV